ncbi:hypothetical protein P872_11935 [Rhodonellum psychrophilum GCM71 = DSM 17998]|uniref:Uncharacterized protein n=2 Tax=Rhodonellum TaxID=336827 RepID=U5BKK3_9BACT|nr:MULTISPECIES: hypothetical protein [Rhodonellum]ERM80990.1 hypothetical protein P872_11935 [Rhodonellum psychrophilum GCM71 = DSM 17998]SDZ29679.1 hypothetical protein SAMN05444412_109153 [Rhodonellum ikkaensis]
MKASAPSKFVWIIGLILGIAGIIGHFTSIDFITANSFNLLLAGFILLALGTSFKGI